MLLTVFTVVVVFTVPLFQGFENARTEVDSTSLAGDVEKSFLSFKGSLLSTNDTIDNSGTFHSDTSKLNQVDMNPVARATSSAVEGDSGEQSCNHDHRRFTAHNGSQPPITNHSFHRVDNRDERALMKCAGRNRRASCPAAVALPVESKGTFSTRLRKRRDSTTLNFPRQRKSRRSIAVMSGCSRRTDDDVNKSNPDPDLKPKTGFRHFRRSIVSGIAMASRSIHSVDVRRNEQFSIDSKKGAHSDPPHGENAPAVVVLLEAPSANAAVQVSENCTNISPKFLCKIHTSFNLFAVLSRFYSRLGWKRRCIHIESYTRVTDFD